MPRMLRAAIIALAAAALSLAATASASAHGFSSVVYATLGSHGGELRVDLQLEYDLLVVSAADAEHDDPLFQAGTAAFEGGGDAERVAAIAAHEDSVLAYVERRFTVASAGEDCAASRTGALSMTERQGAPYLVLHLAEHCSTPSAAHRVTSTLFPDSEGYVTGTKTILSYAIDGHSGSAALDADQRSFSTEQSFGERFWEFFRLGAEHLLTGIDHILFLLALIAGSRRLREVVLAATAFTLAHSVTFILAATKVVSVPSSVVEPTIALSISVVAAWYLFRLWRRGREATEFDAVRGPFGLDRAGWLRLGVVFCFGLIHGLGFASALGIDEPWSWTLLWSLLVFNLGIETVQIGIIVVVFPLIVLLRRRSPRVAAWATGAVAVFVTLAGLFWFVERVFGLGDL